MLANALVAAGFAALGVLTLGVASLALLARRDRRRAAAMVEWTAPLAEIIDIYHPLDTEQPVHDIQLADAHLFDEIAAAYPIDLSWQPPTFTQQWAILGQQMRELGETQAIERVAA